MGLSVFPGNDFGNDPNGLRSLRLLAIKTYINTWAVVLNLPQTIINWALEAYDKWITALGRSTVETGQSEAAYQDMTNADKETFRYYQQCKDLILHKFGQIDKVLKIYGIKGHFPRVRKDKMRAVQALLDGNDALKADGDPHVISDEFIQKLQDYLDASNAAFVNYVLKEKAEALAAVKDQKALKDVDTRHLRSAYYLTCMIWDKGDPKLIQLGFAPTVPRPGNGQPGKPQNVTQTLKDADLETGWDDINNATSYQLAVSEDNSIWEELYFGAENSYTCNPPDSLRYYRVRARNKNGYSVWSEVVSFEPPEE